MQKIPIFKSKFKKKFSREGIGTKRKEKLAVLGGIRSVSNALPRETRNGRWPSGPVGRAHRYPCGFVYFKLDSLFKSDCPPWPRWLTARKVQTSVHLPMGPWVGLDAGTKRRKGRRGKKGRGGEEKGGERALCPLGGALGRETSRSFFGARGRRAPK